MLNAQSLLSTIKRKWRSDVGVDPVVLPHGLVKLDIDMGLTRKQTEDFGVNGAELTLIDFPQNVTLLWAAWTHSTAVSMDTTSKFACDINLDGSTLLAFATAASTTWAPVDVSGKSLTLKTVLPIITKPTAAAFSANISLYLIVGKPPVHSLTGGADFVSAGDNTYNLAISCGAHGTLSCAYTVEGGTINSLDGDTENSTATGVFDATKPLLFTAVPAALYNVDAWTCSIVGAENGDEYTIGGSAQWGGGQPFPTAIGTNVTISVSFVHQ